MQLTPLTPLTQLTPPTALGGREEFIARFLAYQDVRPSSKKTYTKALRQFFRWVDETGRDIRTMKFSDILQFKQALLDNKTSPNTVNLYLTTVRRLYDFLEANDISPNVAKAVKSPKLTRRHSKQALTTDQVKGLLSYAKENLSLRDYALINLIVRTGLRTIEATRATFGDVQFFGGRRVLRVHGKGQDEKKQFVILSPKVWAPIHAYLKAERYDCAADEPLFTTHEKHGPLSTRMVGHICKEALRAIGLNDSAYSAHSLRHTAACSLLKAGVGIEEVREVLRHTSTDTTRIYLQTIEEEMRLSRASEVVLDSVF